MNAPFDPKFVRTDEHEQHRFLRNLIAVATAALPDADGDLFGKPSGLALVNAMHDLTEIDDLYIWAGDICHELRVSREGQPLDRFGEVRS